MPEISSSKYMVQCGWNDVPHLSKEAKEELLKDTPEHLREARMNGAPMLGAGKIYPYPVEEITVPNFVIPAYWPRVYGMDVGWKKTAAIWGAHDRTTDVVYLYTEHYRGQVEPSVHTTAIKARGPWIPGVIDPASAGANQIDGRSLLDMYRAQPLGLKLTPAENAVEAGIWSVMERLSTGRLKVFNTCVNWLKEYALYRRDENGKVVKENDHLMDCFDQETEVLTESGWSKFSALNGDERLATVNLDTDELEYQAPTDFVRRSYVGPMVRIGGRKMDALVTPNHRMVVYQRDHKEPTIRLAKDLKVWDKIKLHAKWAGDKRGPVSVEAAHGRAATVEPIVWAELLGWYIAEGWTASTVQMPGRGYQVGISQTKPEMVERIRSLLAKTPWVWRYANGSFTTSCKWLWEYLRPLGDQYVRHVPDWVKQSEPALIEAFLSGAIAGDGWVQAGSHSYATVSRRLADDMQELFIKAGRSASVRIGRAAASQAIVCGRRHDTVEQYWVQEWRTPHGLLRDSENKPNFGQEMYSGMVYCATVPNGTLVVRRNGKPMVAGNCTRYLVVSGIRLAQTPPIKKDMVGSASMGDRKAGY